jgi:hypothetical protein
VIVRVLKTVTENVPVAASEPAGVTTMKSVTIRESVPATTVRVPQRRLLSPCSRPRRRR